MPMVTVESIEQASCPDCLGGGLVPDDGSLTGTPGQLVTCVCSETDAEAAHVAQSTATKIASGCEPVARLVGVEDDYTEFCRWKGVTPSRTFLVRTPLDSLSEYPAVA